MLTNQILTLLITRIRTTGVALQPTVDSKPSLGTHLCRLYDGRKDDQHCKPLMSELAHELGASTLCDIEFADVDDMLARLRAVAARLP